jgi:hypothetical protein
MVIRKILERLLGSREPISPEPPRELSFEQARVSFEQAQAKYEAAVAEKWEVQQQDDAPTGHRFTGKFFEAAQRAERLRHRLRQAHADFVQAGGSPDTVELTELVTRKVKQWFSVDEQAEAIRLLETECARNLPFCEISDAKYLEDARLAVVKLAGGSLTELRRHIEEAKQDWRDVLVAARDPEAVERGLWSGAKVDDETRREILARDQQQYEEWLRGDGPSGSPAA